MGDYQRLSTDSEAVPPSPYPPLPSSPSSPPLRLQSSSPFQQHKRLIYASLAAVLVLVGLSQVPGAPSATTYFKNDEIPAVDYRGVEQIPPVVSVVEEPLRSFEWKEEPDETLLKQLASLSPVRSVPSLCSHLPFIGSCCPPCPRPPCYPPPSPFEPPQTSRADLASLTGFAIPSFSPFSTCPSPYYSCSAPSPSPSQNDESETGSTRPGKSPHEVPASGSEQQFLLNRFDQQKRSQATVSRQDQMKDQGCTRAGLLRS
jgi:hypothetical protein